MLTGHRPERGREIATLAGPSVGYEPRREHCAPRERSRRRDSSASIWASSAGIAVPSRTAVIARCDRAAPFVERAELGELPAAPHLRREDVRDDEHESQAAIDARTGRRVDAEELGEPGRRGGFVVHGDVDGGGAAGDRRLQERERVRAQRGLGDGLRNARRVDRCRGRPRSTR